MERALLVYTTYPSIVEAERAGRSIVEQRLAACVNILPGMVSHYWWQGAIERGEEVVMIIKTLDPAYLAWLTAETEAAS
jgi:periplasmic divalent cation tolerance protein